MFLTLFNQIPDLKKETQTKLDDYFSDPFGDEDNEDLLKVMDEIDGVQEKKIKLESWIKTDRILMVGNPSRAIK